MTDVNEIWTNGLVDFNDLREQRYFRYHPQEEEENSPCMDFEWDNHCKDWEDFLAYERETNE